MMGGFYSLHLKDRDISNATFDRPDLSAFTILDDLGLEVIGQYVGGDRSVLACKVVGGVVRKLLTVCLCGCCPGRLV